MKQTRLLMGMPISLEVVDWAAMPADFAEIYDYFQSIDERFSVYKESSEISRINSGEITPAEYSDDMKLIFELCEKTKDETDGYFDISHNGRLDPSGLVKGWAINQAAERLKAKNFKNYYVEAGGDIQTAGTNIVGQPWRVGICNPFNEKEIVKVFALSGQGIATSGTYRRGQHIYNPKNNTENLTEIVSLTVIGPNVYEADRFATAAFAMGRAGLELLIRQPGFEAYMIDQDGQATFTAGLNRYLYDQKAR